MLELVKQKGVYLYEYMSSSRKCFDDKLHDKRKLFSFLKGEYISEKDYLHAIGVCIMFKMKTMGNSHDLYLKTDVLLLADVCEKFFSVCLEYYRLDY